MACVFTVLDVVSDFKQRPKFLGLCGAALGMGFTVGPAVGAASVGPFGVGGAFFVCAAISGSVTVLAVIKIEESNPTVLARRAVTTQAIGLRLLFAMF